MQEFLPSQIDNGHDNKQYYHGRNGYKQFHQFFLTCAWVTINQVVIKGSDEALGYAMLKKHGNASLTLFRQG